MIPVQVHASDTGFDLVYVTDDGGGLLFDYTDSELRHPIGIGFQSDNSIWVANYNASTTRHSLFHFDTDGVFLGYGGVVGGGTGDGRFNVTGGANGLCVASDDTFFVCDCGNNRIQKFDSSGTYVLKWGSFGTGNGQFDFQFSYGAMAIDASDNVYVTDRNNKRVQVFNSSGSFLFKFGTNGTGNGQFTAPIGIAIAANGDIYVIDDFWNPGGGARSRIQWFTDAGVYIGQYQSATYGSGNGEFKHPAGLAFDTFGNLYVADEYNDRIQKFDSSMTYLDKWGYAFFAPQAVAARFGFTPATCFDKVVFAQ